jgi:glutaredoxin
VLNDKRCKNCDVTEVLGKLRSMFPTMAVKNVDYNSDEGRQIYSQSGVLYLPALLFSSDVAAAENYDEVSNYLYSAGSYRYLMIGSAFDPTQEICDNGVDDTGNGKVDCDDPYCSVTPVCTKFAKPTITFFIMSFCPYGDDAERAIEPVYKLLGDKASFEPRYIYYENYGDGDPGYCMDSKSMYCSMHGVQEAHQNIREDCVLSKYGISAWFKFALEMDDVCSAKNADTCWADVAESMGYDTDSIRDCQDKEYEAYASKDLMMSKAWGAEGSPTIFINDEPYNGQMTPEGLKRAICAKFTVKPQECSTQL